MNKITMLCFVLLLIVGAGCLFLQGQKLQNIQNELYILEGKETSDLHRIRCQKPNGELDTYTIFIPPEVSNFNRFAEGYCEGMGRSYLPFLK